MGGDLATRLKATPARSRASPRAPCIHEALRLWNARALVGSARGFRGIENGLLKPHARLRAAFRGGWGLGVRKPARLQASTKSPMW